MSIDATKAFGATKDQDVAKELVALVKSVAEIQGASRLGGGKLLLAPHESLELITNLFEFYRMFELLKSLPR